MGVNQMIKKLYERYPLLGAYAWILCLQYFIVQVIVAKAWKTPFSLSKNYISDLGNTVCKNYERSHRLIYICSPEHSLMNASFIALGIFMIVGAVLIYQRFEKTMLNKIGFSFLGLGGIGTIVVGLFPENTIGALHAFGALLPFLLGNVGVVLLGYGLRLSRLFRLYSIVSGIIALLFLLFYSLHLYLGLGLGGSERVISYSQTSWLVVTGAYLIFIRRPMSVSTDIKP